MLYCDNIDDLNVKGLKRLIQYNYLSIEVAPNTIIVLKMNFHQISFSKFWIKISVHVNLCMLMRQIRHIVLFIMLSNDRKDKLFKKIFS